MFIVLVGNSSDCISWLSSYLIIWQKEEAAQQHQFILHAALDIVEDLAWTTSAMWDSIFFLLLGVYVNWSLLPSIMYLHFLHISCSCRFLKAVDKFNDLVVSVYVTAGHILTTVFRRNIHTNIWSRLLKCINCALPFSLYVLISWVSKVHKISYFKVNTILLDEYSQISRT